MDWQFKELEASDVEVLLPYFALRPTNTCDSTLFDSYLWRKYYHARFCIRDGKAVEWLMKLHSEIFAALPLCTAEDLSYYVKDMEAYFNQVLGAKMRLYGVDEKGLEILNLDPDKYDIKEQDDRDYLYDANDLRRLPGKKFHKKKNHINAFKREYEGRYEYRRLTARDKQDMWKMLDRWRETKGEVVEEHLNYEVRGIHDVLTTSAILGVRMGGIYIDDRLEAFSMASYNETFKMPIIHIEKANPDIRGLYPFINQQFLIHEFPDALLVNREDDLGLEGLRKAKESYHPVGFARKFSIYQK